MSLVVDHTEVLEDRTRNLNFYGLRIRIALPPDLTLPVLANEFTLFDEQAPVSAPSDVAIRLIHEPPVLAPGLWLPPAYSTPRNVCYYERGEKLIDYHGRALVREWQGRNVDIISDDEELLETIAYTAILYHTGAYFDRIGRHRVHALGFTFEGKGCLVLLPMGGGKSTLLLELLKDPRIKLLGEDTPLISAEGMISPFPVKIGVLAGKVPDEIPREYVSQLRSLEGPVKEVISLAYFSGRIETTPAEVKKVFLGERFLGEQARIAPVSYFKAWKRFFRDCVVGLGVYQGLEFAITASPAELIRYTGRAIRRTAACSAFLRRCEHYRFEMGNNPSMNAAALLGMLNR